jgi:tryptophanyl-tRNA synthetase
LHLGHYVGSLKNRLKLQDAYEAFIIIADVQALTTHLHQSRLIKESSFEVCLDYLAAGIDPEKTTIFLQSQVPEIAELTVFFSMLVNLSFLRHNPTIKTEALEKGMGEDLTYGFFGYPISQAADITFVKAQLVPVGEDQVPHIEQTRKIVRKFNRLFGPVLVEPKALLDEVPRLIGLDGKLKMSKSYNNAVFLKDPPEVVQKKLFQAVTDPARIHPNDPGHPDICTVFAYHRVFNETEVPEIEESCRLGKLRCVDCKANLAGVINRFLEPIRKRRSQFEQRAPLVWEILEEGTKKARAIGHQTLCQVKEVMGLSYFLENSSKKALQETLSG